MKRKREGLVGKHSKRTSIRFIALIVSFVQGICTAKTAASELSETELRAVISSWRTVRQTIEKGAPVKESIPGWFLGRGKLEDVPKLEKRQILEFARELEPWRDAWFIIEKDVPPRHATVYFMPDQVQGRMRRGKSVTISLFHAQMRVLYPEVKFHWFDVHEYVQIGDERLDQFQPGEKNLPFEVSGSVTFDQIEELIRLVYLKPRYLRGRDGTFLNQTDPILSISQFGETLTMTTGVRHSGLDGQGQSIKCTSHRGVLSITEIYHWVN